MREMGFICVFTVRSSGVASQLRAQRLYDEQRRDLRGAAWLAAEPYPPLGLGHRGGCLVSTRGKKRGDGNPQSSNKLYI